MLKSKKKVTTDNIYDPKTYHGFICHVFCINHFTAERVLVIFVCLYCCFPYQVKKKKLCECAVVVVLMIFPPV